MIRTGCCINKQLLPNPLHVNDCCTNSFSFLRCTLAWSKINLLYKLFQVNMYCLLYDLLILLPSLSVPSPTFTVTALCKGELFIGAILHLLGATGCYIIQALHMILFFFFNQSEDTDSWLPTLFGNLSLSFEIRRRVLLGSKGIGSRAHYHSKNPHCFT